MTTAHYNYATQYNDAQGFLPPSLFFFFSCFSISFLLELLQPCLSSPWPLSGFPLSSPPPCAPSSPCQHPATTSSCRALVPQSPPCVPSIRASLSHPMLLVAFRIAEDNVSTQSLPSQVKHRPGGAGLALGAMGVATAGRKQPQ